MKIGVAERARGRWRSILPMVGIPSSFLTGKHGPCPICKEGKDRWRWTNHQDSGSWVCNVCGNGTGIDLVMAIHGKDFQAAALMIEAVLGATVEDKKQAKRSEADNLRRMKEVWASGCRILSGDPVSQYLAARGIELETFSNQLRFVTSLAYPEGPAPAYPAMIARVVSSEGVAVNVHRTWLGVPAGYERRKLMAGTIAPGSAIRLAPAGYRLGVAEGIETALSASFLFDMPVWALLNAGNLSKFKPPDGVRELHIFGDADENFVGQSDAYTLARKSYSKDLSVEVHLPEIGEGDWNDIHRRRLAVDYADSGIISPNGAFPSMVLTHKTGNSGSSGNDEQHRSVR